MLNETIIAFFLLTCLVCFSIVNLHNILRTHKRTSSIKADTEVAQPSGFIVGVAALGTFIYALEVLLYEFLVFSGNISVLSGLPVQFQFLSIFSLQLLGLVLTFTGYFLFIWSVIARGRYSVSWEMPEDQKLVTWGPYRYVRHPSYLGYFLIFIGFFFLWPNLFTLFPFSAIPSYYKITFDEERLLAKRFGDSFIKYQKRTGRLFPKIRQN
jgi:protein-S-isoprenylcysteine O-methyltransferase Ste14